MNSFEFLEYTRKAESWEHVSKARPNLDITKMKLPEANILGKTPCSDFTGKAPGQFFIARNDHGVFLINTEGYDYARYALKLVVS